MVKKDVTTYFLAQKSGLFRPGAATILANSPLKMVSKPKFGLRKEGQKKLGQGGGQSSGGLPISNTPVVPYVAKAVHFDGSAYLSNNSLIATDNAFFSYAVWLRVNPVDIINIGTNVTYWVVDPENIYGGAAWISQSPDSRFDVTNSSGLTLSQALGDTVMTDAWYAIMGSVDVTSDGVDNIIQSYLGDVAQTALNPNAHAGTVVGQNGLPFWVGNDGGDLVPFDLCNLIIWPGTFIDWSVESKRRKIISNVGKAVDPANAVSAFGAPAVLMSGNDVTFGVNQGTGGAFTLTGTLTNATTSPSD